MPRVRACRPTAAPISESRNGEPHQRESTIVRESHIAPVELAPLALRSTLRIASIRPQGGSQCVGWVAAAQRRAPPARIHDRARISHRAGGTRACGAAFHPTVAQASPARECVGCVAAAQRRAAPARNDDRASAMHRAGGTRACGAAFHPTVAQATPARECAGCVAAAQRRAAPARPRSRKHRASCRWNSRLRRCVPPYALRAALGAVACERRQARRSWREDAKPLRSATRSMSSRVCASSSCASATRKRLM